MIKTLFAIVVLSATSFGQRILPPQPNYSQYGSHSRQMTVYVNSQERLNALEIQKFRRFREEVARTTIQPNPQVIVRTRMGQDRCCWRR